MLSQFNSEETLAKWWGDTKFKSHLQEHVLQIQVSTLVLSQFSLYSIPSLLQVWCLSAPAKLEKMLPSLVNLKTTLLALIFWAFIHREDVVSNKKNCMLIISDPILLFKNFKCSVCPQPTITTSHSAPCYQQEREYKWSFYTYLTSAPVAQYKIWFIDVTL